MHTASSTCSKGPHRLLCHIMTLFKMLTKRGCKSCTAKRTCVCPIFSDAIALCGHYQGCKQMPRQAVRVYKRTYLPQLCYERCQGQQLQTRPFGHIREHWVRFRAYSPALAALCPASTALHQTPKANVCRQWRLRGTDKGYLIVLSHSLTSTMKQFPAVQAPHKPFANHQHALSDARQSLCGEKKTLASLWFGWSSLSRKTEDLTRTLPIHGTVNRATNLGTQSLGSRHLCRQSSLLSRLRSDQLKM
jgi:hypothetical protein